MIKQPFTKTQEIPFNLGKDTYMQIVLQTDKEQMLVAQNPPVIKLWATHKFYKTTKGPVSLNSV